MNAIEQVLVLGGTGRTGRRVLEQLAARGIRCRALVRSAQRLPPALAASPLVSVVEADLPSLPDAALGEHLRGCGAAISCLGHNLSLRGIFGPPRDLVTASTARLCRAVDALGPAAPVRLVLMSSVSVNHPAGLDTRRGALERGFIALLRAVLPPAADNQSAADLLHRSIGPDHPRVQWAVVRPDSLRDGEVAEYRVHEQLVASVFAPRSTRMASVAHFMCELATSPSAWERWRGRMPVIVDAEPSPEATQAVAGTQSGGARDSRDTKGGSAPAKPPFRSGSPAWTRTTDKRINSPLLCQLSYWGMAGAGM